MSEPIETNDNTPAPAENVTPLRPNADQIRARLQAQEQQAQRGGRGPMPPTISGDPDTGSTYEVVVADPNGGVLTLIQNGFIVATSVFVGFADTEGLLQAVFPLDRIVYVREQDAPVSEDETPDTTAV